MRKNWEAIKRLEGKKSIVDGIPSELPALMRAHRIQAKASVVGFDWKEKADVWKKVVEEVDELEHAEQTGQKKEIEHEFGDLLFALVNYSRFLGTDPEFALRNSVDRFSRRFGYIEETLQRKGKGPTESSFEEMDLLWNEAKKKVG